MDEPRWAAALQGNCLDLQDARRALESGVDVRVISFKRPVDRTIVALIAREFDSLHTAEEVNAAAGRFVTMLNGILFAVFPDRLPLTLWGIHHRQEDGSWSGGQSFLAARGTARGRARAYASSIGDTASVSREAGWMALIDDEVVSDVLHMLRGEPDWIELFRAFERIKHDVEDHLPAGERLADLHWWPSTGKFTGDAQLYRHAKGSPRYAEGRVPMELSAAQTLVSQLLQRWLNWRVTLAAP